MRGIVGAAHTKCSGAPARLSLCNTLRGGGKGGGSKPPPYGGWLAIRESPLRADERCSPLHPSSVIARPNGPWQSVSLRVGVDMLLRDSI